MCVYYYINATEKQNFSSIICVYVSIRSKTPVIFFDMSFVFYFLSF